MENRGPLSGTASLLALLSVAFAVFALLTVPGVARAQLVLQNNFVKASFNPTGDLIAPLGPGGIKQTVPNAHGLQFDPTGSANFTDATELLAFAPFPAESFVVQYNGMSSTNGALFGTNFNNTGVVIAPNGQSESITFTEDLKSSLFGASILELQQTATLDLVSNLPQQLDLKRLAITATLTNLTSNPITNVSYLRTANPKQGESPLQAGHQVSQTANALSTTILPGGIAMDSTIPTVGLNDPLQRHLALGSTAVGTFIDSVGNAAANNDVHVLEATGDYQLTAPGNPPTFSTSGIPFVPDVQAGTTALNLWYDFGTLGANASVSADPFYYVMQGPSAVSVVPEPSAWVLMASGLGCCAFLGAASRRRLRSGRA